MAREGQSRLACRNLEFVLKTSEGLSSRGRRRFCGVRSLYNLRVGMLFNKKEYNFMGHRRGPFYWERVSFTSFAGNGLC